MPRVIMPPDGRFLLEYSIPSLFIKDCVYWTDGHCFIPCMSKLVSGLMKRPSDGYLFWEDDAEDFGSTEARQSWLHSANAPAPIECIIPFEWANLEFVEAATEEDYFRALNTGLADTRDRELSIREQLLHIHNHPMRYGEYRRDSSRHTNNQARLVDMLSENVEEQILKAEIFREDYLLDEANALLEKLDVPEGDFLFPKLAKIRELAAQGFTEVAIWKGVIAGPQPYWGFQKKLTGF